MISSKTTIHHACVDSAVTLFGNIFTGGKSMGNVSYSVITLCLFSCCISDIKSHPCLNLLNVAAPGSDSTPVLQPQRIQYDRQGFLSHQPLCFQR